MAVQCCTVGYSCTVLTDRSPLYSAVTVSSQYPTVRYSATVHTALQCSTEMQAPFFFLSFPYSSQLNFKIMYSCYLIQFVTDVQTGQTAPFMSTRSTRSSVLAHSGASCGSSGAFVDVPAGLTGPALVASGSVASAASLWACWWAVIDVARNERVRWRTS